MLSAPSTAELAAFTGRAVGTFSAFATQALAQATLLFTITTQLGDYPEDDDAEQLARNAILELADRIYLEQPYAAAKATPYNSETIGSYSYAKGGTFSRVREGERIGLFWWDLAIDELAVADRSIVDSGSVANLDRADVYVDGDGNRYVLGPAEYTGPDGLGLDVNAELNPRPRLG